MTQSTDHTSRVCDVLIDNFDTESCSSITTHSRYTYHQSSVVGVIIVVVHVVIIISFAQYIVYWHKQYRYNNWWLHKTSSAVAKGRTVLHLVEKFVVTQGHWRSVQFTLLSRVCFKFLLVFQCNYMSFLLLLRYFLKKSTSSDGMPLNSKLGAIPGD